MKSIIMLNEQKFITLNMAGWGLPLSYGEMSKNTVKKLTRQPQSESVWIDGQVYI